MRTEAYRHYSTAVLNAYAHRWGLRIGILCTVLLGLFGGYRIVTGHYHQSYLSLLTLMLLFGTVTGMVGGMVAQAVALLRLASAKSNEEQLGILIRLEGNEEELED